MILQRLCEAADQFDFPPFGYQEGAVKWIVDLDAEGNCLGFVQTTSGGDRKGKDPGKRMHIPATATPRSGTNAPPQLLADNAEYVFGVCSTDASSNDRARAQRNKAAFLALVEECAADTGWPPIGAVVRALRTDACAGVLPPDITRQDRVTFRVGGQLLISSPTVKAYWAGSVSSTRASRSAGTARCLVCGGEGLVANPHPQSVKRVPGGDPGGCMLVSINENAFDSYGHKKQLSQAPVCWQCAETYLKVLQALLDSDDHCVRIGKQLAYLCWTREVTSFSPATLLSAPEPADVRRLLETAYGPGDSLDDEDLQAFHALSLSGSKTRIILRDWFETTLGTVKRNLGRYFAAQEISSGDPDQDKPLGLYALMGALIPSKGKDPWKALAPDLVSQVVKTALLGTPLPISLLQSAVSRARTEHPSETHPQAITMTRPRAAVIKMCLLLSNHREEGFDVKAELDPDISTPAFLCGRLLAVLEDLQGTAIPGAKATLVDRYYGTASVAPASVFGNLMRLAQAHLGKLRKSNEGAHYRLQQELEDVAGRLGGTFPSTLTLIQQGEFALGYYQQRAAHHAAAIAGAAAKKARQKESDQTEEAK